MSCTQTRVTLSVWDPHHDLPDGIVGHLEACDACMAVFEGRFPPVRVPATEAPARRRPSHTMWALAAAMLLAFLPLGGLTGPAPSFDAVAQAAPPECPMPADLPPECPPA